MTELLPTDAPDIVVVEDDDGIREALGCLLEGWGYSVRSAENGARGLALILELPPRVAVVDISMPKLDGYELARRVRAALGSEGITLVALTSFSRQADRNRALDAGFDIHLTKPATLELLRQAVAPSPDSGVDSAVAVAS
ncbi:MAG TPA: response regulator [Thermoanaerobaculia bacterium]|nr:response regulator [Thermoanaerobaculia bacterium]